MRVGSIKYCGFFEERTINVTAIDPAGNTDESIIRKGLAPAVFHVPVVPVNRVCAIANNDDAVIYLLGY